MNNMGMFGIVWVVLLSIGCSNDNSCVLDEECFAGEACLDDRCQRAPDEMQDNASNGSTNNATPTNNDMSSNNGGANSGTNAGPDNAETNNGTSNETNNQSNNTTGVCRGSSFDSCPADDDERNPEYLNGEFSQGCPGPNDEFGAGTITTSTRSICPLEDSDRYDTTVTRCQSAPFFVDVEVVPTEECAMTDWVLDASFNGNDCVETNSVVECTELPNGGKRATFIVEPGSSFHSLYTTIEPRVENLRFDYDLTITFRQ